MGPSNDTERLFLSVLERWERLLPDGEHLPQEDRQLYLRRALSWLSYEETGTLLQSATQLIIELTTVAEAATQGKMRPEWGLCLREIANDFFEVSDVFLEVHPVKLH